MASTQQLLLGEGAGGAEKNYIEDVFSTYLYTGNGSTQTITNGIDLSTKGGMVWIKSRSRNAANHQVFDTSRGATKELITNSTAAEATDINTLTSFNSNGFSLDADATVNNNAATYVSWSFREQPKFFDVVTYTGNGTYYTPISHNLGSTPGCIMIKQTSASGQNWAVYHRSISGNGYLRLNTTESERSDNNVFPAGGVNASTFNVGADAQVNANGATYVAYLFAHDAGGFGLTGTDNVISCGSYTGTETAGVNVTLGYEPQWVLIKQSSGAGQEWAMLDTMRGLVTGTGGDSQLFANTSAAETTGSTYVAATATGFQLETYISRYNASGATYIYIAIRRGPMKVPTDATKVFAPVAQTTAAPTTVTTNFPVDMEWFRNSRTTVGRATVAYDRLRGTQRLHLNVTDAEITDTAPAITYFDSNIAFRENLSASGQSGIFWSFRRAPSFFDEVCYAGTGVARTVAHNLGVAPELILVKSRNGGQDWRVYNATIGASKYLVLNWINGATSSAPWNNTAPTSSVFSLNASVNVNTPGSKYVAYLFATCAGVSKIGSYTGTGTTLQVDCGFAAGARFVLIKRTNTTSDWYVWDTARGIVSGNDPYLLLNSTAAEVTSTDYVDTYSAGFEISSTAPAAINQSGGTYIYLAIA